MRKAALKRQEMMIRIELNRTTEFYKHIFRKYTTKCKKNEKREIIWRQNTKEKKINFLCAKSKTGNEGNPEGKLQQNPKK